MSHVQRTREAVRVLGPGDVTEFLLMLEQDPVVNVFADHRARTTMLDPRWLGGEVWGRFVNGELVAACHAAANLVPINCTEQDAVLFAEHARRGHRRAGTIVGPAAAATVMWDILRPGWGVARSERLNQPHLELAGPPAVEPDPWVRHTTPDDLAALYPACVAMYTEEVGVSPEVGGGADFYRTRVRQLIGRGWSFARFDEAGRVLFKAEIASSSPYAAQVQGVWVAPEYRGQGYAAAGMAAVSELVRRDIAPVVSLYLNDYNTPALRTYAKVGFRQTATFATIMF